MYYLFKKLDNHYICYNILFNKRPIDYYKLYELFDTNDFNVNLENTIEIGPIPNFKSSLSSNILNILKKSNINFIDDIEVSYIYDKDNYKFDKMTQIIYKNKLDLSKSIVKNSEINININELINDDKYGLSLENEDKEYLVENHLICIKYNLEFNKDELVALYKKIINSFTKDKTREFIQLYFSNNAINVAELCNILPIYDI